jgi:hypothetical protein
MLRRRDDYGWKVAAGMLLGITMVYAAVLIAICSVTNYLLPGPASGYQQADQTEAE